MSCKASSCSLPDETKESRSCNSPDDLIAGSGHIFAAFRAMGVYTLIPSYLSLFNFTQFLKSNANCKFIMPQARLPPQSRSNRSVAPNIPASKRWNHPPINPKLEKSFKQHHWLEDNTHGFLFKRNPSVCQTCPNFAARPEINYYIADIYLIGFAFSPKCVEHSTSCLHMKLFIVHYCNVVQ